MVLHSGAVPAGIPRRPVSECSHSQARTLGRGGELSTRAGVTCTGTSWEVSLLRAGGATEALGGGRMCRSGQDESLSRKQRPGGAAEERPEVKRLMTSGSWSPGRMGGLERKGL